MNTQEQGIPVFNIVNKVGKIIDTVYLNEFDGASEIKLEKDEHTQLIPRNKDRDILYVTGASGSGKSYYTLQYLKEYHNKYPKNDIYLFSSLKEDETLDKLNGIKRININNPEFVDEEFEITDFSTCMLVFDDTDCISNKFIRAKVQEILSMALETGRHTKTSVIYTSHLPSKGHETKIILNEAHNIVFFPRGLGGASLAYLLKNQLGLNNQQIKNIKSLKSRAITYVKTFPNIIVFEKGAYII